MRQEQEKLMSKEPQPVTANQPQPVTANQPQPVTASQPQSAIIHKKTDSFKPGFLIQSSNQKYLHSFKIKHQDRQIFLNDEIIHCPVSKDESRFKSMQQQIFVTLGKQTEKNTSYSLKHFYFIDDDQVQHKIAEVEKMADLKKNPKINRLAVYGKVTDNKYTSLPKKQYISLTIPEYQDRVKELFPEAIRDREASWAQEIIRSLNE